MGHRVWGVWSAWGTGYGVRGVQGAQGVQVWAYGAWGAGAGARGMQVDGGHGAGAVKPPPTVGFGVSCVSIQQGPRFLPGELLRLCGQRGGPGGVLPHRGRHGPGAQGGAVPRHLLRQRRQGRPPALHARGLVLLPGAPRVPGLPRRQLHPPSPGFPPGISATALQLQWHRNPFPCLTAVAPHPISRPCCWSSSPSDSLPGPAAALGPPLRTTDGAGSARLRPEWRPLFGSRWERGDGCIKTVPSF